MSKKGKKIFLIVWAGLIAALLAAIFIIGLPEGHAESITDVMRDGVLHDTNRVSLFGLVEVSPALISAFVVSAILLTAAVLIRIFAIPRFKDVPGRFQCVIEKITEYFMDTASNNSPHRSAFLGAYIFAAGVYIFFGTVFELFGVQAAASNGNILSLPAPLADINGAIGMGVLSYAVILGAGAVSNGPRGVLRVLKDFSLPISMSFRLFGALLSGMLVTELVYHYSTTSFGLPVIVGVLLTLLNALIQAFVLITLVSIFFGEAVEPPKKKTDAKG